MRAKVMILALSACAAFGQDAARVFRVYHVDTEMDLNVFATLIRGVSDLPNVSIDTERKSISVSGSASQVAIAEWLFTELDRQTLPEFATKEFRVPTKDDDVVRVFFAPHTATAEDFQEIATTIRTIPDVRKVFTYNSPRALVVRGTADQIAAVAFLIHELDQPADAKRADSREYQMIDPANRGETAVRVFYLPYTSTVQQFQEVATVTRTIGEVRRIFTYNATRAMIVRGTADQIAFIGWMVHELGKPVTPGTASSPYQYPRNDRDGENLVRVFYVKDVATVQAFQQLATQIRTQTKMRRVFTYNESKAITLRGTEAQLALAEQMLNDRQIAAK
jgi:hypothetical protein